jgi:hypothetical protein
MLCADAMKTIAWDVDDVLNDLMRMWLECAWRPAHPDCAIRYDEIKENPPCDILQCTKTEYLTSLDAFRQSTIACEMPPIPQVLEWFEQNGARARHIAITAVPLAAAHLSAAWVMRHFGRWIRTFHVLPSHRATENLPVYDHSKGEALQQWKAIDAFVDDDLKNLDLAEQLGIRTVCIPRPWNHGSGSLIEILDGLMD